jgi:NADPH:quinone reductase-like Zn-dependent oxidoreductase/uncharacterized membrane protein YphA (DoxX/SURF4 family)
MKALVFEQYGGPEVLRVAEVAEPHAGPGQIRIAVRTAGVSPGDDAMRSGAWRDRVPLTLPHVVGAGVTGVRPGAEVFGLRALGGTTAEHARLDAWAAKPPGMTWAQAGGAASGIETSVRALDALGVGPGTTVLLDGASGGVGAFAVQIAVARGARVIGTASPANHEFLASLGAEPVAYGPGLPERIGSPVDAAIDVAGRGGLAELMALTGDPAAVLTLIDPAAAALGVRLSRFDPAGDHQAALSYGARLIADGRLTVPVAAVFPITAGRRARPRGDRPRPGKGRDRGLRCTHRLTPFPLGAAEVNTVLWVIAIVLAVVFLFSGLLKVIRPREKLAESGIGWTEDVRAGPIKLIGALEVLAAAGLILPAALDIAPVLTPLAATGLGIIMIGATVVHARRREYPLAAFTVVLLILSAVVAWGRFGSYSF